MFSLGGHVLNLSRRPLCVTKGHAVALISKAIVCFSGQVLDESVAPVETMTRKASLTDWKRTEQLVRAVRVPGTMVAFEAGNICVAIVAAFDQAVIACRAERRWRLELRRVGAASRGCARDTSDYICRCWHGVHAMLQSGISGTKESVDFFDLPSISPTG